MGSAHSNESAPKDKLLSELIARTVSFRKPSAAENPAPNEGSPTFDSGLIVYPIPDLRAPGRLWRATVRSPEKRYQKKLRIREYEGDWGYNALVTEKLDWQRLREGIVAQEKKRLQGED